MAGFDPPTSLALAGCEPPPDLPRGQPSDARPWLAWLLAQLERGSSIKRIHENLLVEHPTAAAVSYDSVRRLLKKHGAARLPCIMGEH